MNKSIIGLAQAVGVAVYCGMVGGFFWLAKNYFEEPAGFLGTVLMLVLLVFSVAVVGSIIFGYPIYLALNKKIKDGLSVLAYTLLSSLAIILVILIVLFLR